MNIEQLFNESGDTKITYNGQELIRADAVQLDGEELEMKFSFLSTDSTFKQGVAMETEGEFLVNDLSIRNKLTLWEHTAPKEVSLKIHSRDQWLVIYNIWKPEGELLNFSSGSGHAAMQVSITGNRRTYRCNDGEGEGLNNLVFDIDITPSLS